MGRKLMRPYSAPSRDEEGEELPDDEGRVARSHDHCGLFKNIDGKFRPGQKWSLEISDENDNSLFYRHPRWER
jgi:hypothetical protein